MPNLPGKYVLILSDVPEHLRHDKDGWRGVKDMIRDDHLDFSEVAEPERANIIPQDPRIAMCDIVPFEWAWTAFISLNGYEWFGRRLRCILRFPNGARIMLPSTDRANVALLIQYDRTGSGHLYSSRPSQAQTHSHGYDGRNRNPSLSSVSSHSSVGSVTPPSPFSPRGQGSREYRRSSLTYSDVQTVSAVVDVTTGNLVRSDSGAVSNILPNNRYHVLLITNPVPHFAQTLPTVVQQPTHGVLVERRRIIIRELNKSVDQGLLEALLHSHGVQDWRQCQLFEKPRCHAFVEFATPTEAGEAVRRLHGKDHLERRLDVKLARDAIRVGTAGHERTGSLTSNVSTMSSSGLTTLSGRLRQGPRIVNGDV